MLPSKNHLYTSIPAPRRSSVIYINCSIDHNNINGHINKINVFSTSSSYPHQNTLHSISWRHTYLICFFCLFSIKTRVDFLSKKEAKNKNKIYSLTNKFK